MSDGGGGALDYGGDCRWGAVIPGLLDEGSASVHQWVWGWAGMVTILKALSLTGIPPLKEAEVPNQECGGLCSYTACGNLLINRHSHYGKQYGGSLRN